MNEISPYHSHKLEVYTHLPVELSQFVESYAWEKGYSYGQHEVDLIAYQMGQDLAIAYAKFKERKKIVDN
jgi:hypothetical protein